MDPCVAKMCFAFEGMKCYPVVSSAGGYVWHTDDHEWKETACSKCSPWAETSHDEVLMTLAVEGVRRTQ